MNPPVALVMVFFGVALFFPESEAGCLELGVCCTGRNMSCTTAGWRPDRSFGTCYCDQACCRTLDCCHDYAEACTGLPCSVSEWSSWSGCSKPCKSTYRIRTRQIIQEPTSGEHCPPVLEKAGCLEYWNEQGLECRQDIVPALITTESFGKARRKRYVSNEDERAGYCVEFQLISVTKACLIANNAHSQWMQDLREGYTVCVECQPPAMNQGSHRCYGDGRGAKRNQLLHWKAVGNPQCKGGWKRVRQRDNCSCATGDSLLFI
ncbi:somatomedin-B and thrombospondin type-1 domain-containing protein-like [Ambystoma mexicanum]|uniref:somatomedin-B and thrombospondin type-1 domain-containing protein-like n=1 Tax=Ambystoma mexicanum TaxID=8296 RepID=UPI0037E716D9